MIQSSTHCDWFTVIYVSGFPFFTANSNKKPHISKQIRVTLY